jgi:SNF2 family DNA or RNA helicase
VLQPSSKEIKRLHTTGDLELRRLFIMFGDESNVSEEKRDEEVKAYQTDLEKHIFKNGGQLRDYQAEGVSWLMSNYVNQRSSILADEMG